MKMEIYENVWKSGWAYYERVRDSETKKVYIRKIEPVWEYFEKDPDGEFSYIIDNKIKLKQKLFYNSKDAKEYKGFMESVGREIYGNQQPEYRHIRENYFNIKEQVDMRIFFFDIEVITKDRSFPDPQEAIHPVTQIQILDSYTDKIIILSLDAMKEKEKFKKYGDQLIFKHYLSEKVMFEDFFKILDTFMPTVITAWNGESFDFPYITNRIKNIPGINETRLSPIRRISEYKMEEGVGYNWDGLYLIDMMKAYKKFVFTPQVSYALDNIAKEELGVGSGKVDYGEYDNIIDFHDGDIDKFLDYSIQDVVILKNLENKIKLIALMKILANMMGINYDDTMGTVKPWTQYITNLAMAKKQVMPYRNTNKLGHPIVGGFVREPIKGKSNWLMSVDINSMYPLLGMRAHNMSPEMYIEEKDLNSELMEIRNKYHSHEDENIYIKPDVLNEIREVCHNNNVSYGMNCFFRKDEEGIIPRVVGDIYSNRKIAKGKMLMYKALQAKFKAIHD